MARRLLRACWCAALLAPLGLAARVWAKPPDLPLEPQGAVRPQLIDPDAVGNEDAPPAAGFLPQPANRLRPADCTPVTPLHIATEQLGLDASDFGGPDIGRTDKVCEELCEPAAPRGELLPVPSLYRLRPSVRRQVMSSVLFSVHPLMTLMPTDKLLDCPSDHPPMTTTDVLLDRMCACQYDGCHPYVDPEAVELKMCWQECQGDWRRMRQVQRHIVTKAINMGLPIHVWRFSLPESSQLAYAPPDAEQETLQPDTSRPSCDGTCPGLRPRQAERHVYQFTAPDLTRDVLHNLEKLQAAHRLMHLAEHLALSGRVCEALECFEIVCHLCPGRFEGHVSEILAHVFSPVDSGSTEDAEDGAYEELPAPKPEPEEKATDREAEIERKLNTPVSINFTDMPLRQIIDDIRAWSGINIYVDEPALLPEGYSLDRPITLKLEQVSLKSALNLMLHNLHLTYVVKDDVLQITTEACARADKMMLSTYKVSDLVCPAKRRAAKKSDVESLIHLITSTIRPQSWAEQGGPGSIDYHARSRSLVISQTPDVQEQVADLLAALRHLMEKEAALSEVAPCPSACPKCEKLHAARAKGTHEQVEGLMKACRLAAEAGRHAKAAELAREAFALDAERVRADPLVYKMHLLALKRDKGKARRCRPDRGAEECEPPCPRSSEGDGSVPVPKDGPTPLREPALPPVDPGVVGALEHVWEESEARPEEAPHHAGVSLHGRYFDVDCSWTGLRMQGHVPLRGSLYHLQFWNGAVSGWVTPNPADFISQPVDGGIWAPSGPQRLTPERVDGAIQ